MPGVFAILIGVDEADGLPTAEYAGASIEALAKRLEGVGNDKSRQFTLTGPTATRSAIESRLRKIAKTIQPGDTVWLAFAGPSFVVEEQTLLACGDTLADDREETSLVLADMLSALNGTAIHLLLDTPDFAAEELDELFPMGGPSVALTACSEDETSHAAKGKRLWLQLIGDALSGSAGITELTADALNAWLKDELPRAIRKVIAQPDPQTPQLFGDGSRLLATVTPAPVAPTAKLDLKKLKRIVFRGEKRGRVKDLSGVQPGMDLPKSASPSSQKWIYKLASEDLKKTVDETFNALREQLGFKRKDLETTIESDGLAIIRTPKFDFAVSVSLDPDDVSSVIWRREISQIADAEVLRSDGFRKTFGAMLSTLEFEFEKPIDVEALVDRIEDEPPPGVTVRVTPDGTSCDVNVQGFPGKIHVEQNRLRIEGRPGSSPDSLVEQFFEFQTRFGGKRGLPKLKG